MQRTRLLSGAADRFREPASERGSGSPRVGAVAEPDHDIDDVR